MIAAMKIGERILFARKQVGLSQTHLASTIGVTRGACSQWERGVTVPSVEHLSSLAIELSVSFEWLATGRVADESLRAAVEDKLGSPGTSEALEEFSLLYEQYSALPHESRDSIQRLIFQLRRKNGNS